MNNTDMLVSIIVVSYNSEATIVDTLNSILGQSYKRLELIVTDDGSKDNTIETASEWIKRHESRFERTELVTTEVNTGIPANLNRGLSKAHGEWIKSIAADDALEIDCISDNVDFILSHPDAKICHSKVTMYRNSFDEDKIVVVPDYRHNVFTQDNCSPKLQLNYSYIGAYIKASTLFYKASYVKEMGGFDERIKLCEDLPFYLKVCKAGEKFYYMDKKTVKYRLNDNSIYTGSMKKTLFPKFYVVDEEIYKYYIRDCEYLSVKFVWKYSFLCKKLFTILHINRDIFVLRLLYKLLIAPSRFMGSLFLMYSRMRFT